MLCYRCGSHVPDGSAACGACGQELSSGRLRAATASFSRRRPTNAALESAPLHPGDAFGERYLVREAVGAGPSGFVFRALDRRLGADVALKVIAPRLLETQEARLAFRKALAPARRLSHDNLLRAFDAGDERGRAFFTAPLLDGLSLRRIIDLRRGMHHAFALEEVEPIFAQLAAALESGHRLGVHACLKPENVIVLPNLLKLTDFGLALALPRALYASAQSGASRRCLAPEYEKGAALDARADVFSLGILLEEMLGAVVHEPAQSLPGGVEALCRKATRENPAERHGSAAAFLADLRGLLRGRPTPSPALNDERKPR